MRTVRYHVSGGNQQYDTNSTPPPDIHPHHISRPRHFKRLESLRPMTSWLHARDLTRLEKMRHETPPLDILLGRLLCTKLADARLLDDDDSMHRYAAYGDIISFSLNGGSPQTAQLGRALPRRHATRLASIDLRSFIGLTLIGMKPGQQTRLLSIDCTVGTLSLLHISRPPFPASLEASNEKGTSKC